MRGAGKNCLAVSVARGQRIISFMAVRQTFVRKTPIMLQVRISSRTGKAGQDQGRSPMQEQRVLHISLAAVHGSEFPPRSAADSQPDWHDASTIDTPACRRRNVHTHRYR